MNARTDLGPGVSRIDLTLPWTIAGGAGNQRDATDIDSTAHRSVACR